MITSFVILTLASIYQAIDAQVDQKSFVIDYENNQFLKDGKPFRYISAGMHYFRIPRIYWYDRLLKAKAIGVNTIQTYVAWNVHEEIRGIYDFEGENDIFHFTKLAQSLDLLVILRPGPYIDAEWEFGGFPPWLANDTSLKMRSLDDPRYFSYVESWFTVLLTKLKPLLYKNEGPVIAFQVENEYGNYYACDKNYLEKLKDIYEKIVGTDVVLFTTDGYTDEYMQCGTTSSIFATIDFGTEITAEDAFKQQRKYQPKGPFVNSEYYTGWLDYWGSPHQTRDGTKIAMYLDKILSLNASVNLYMFIGGTNFAFMNGVDESVDELQFTKRRFKKIQRETKFQISPTSYDYDAPLSEAGDPTNKYFLLRNVIAKYSEKPLIPVPRATIKTAYGNVDMSSAMDLHTYIKQMYPRGAPYNSTHTLTMENIGQSYGFLLYRSVIPRKYQNQIVTLTIDAVHDRTKILIDGGSYATVSRGYVNIDIPGGQIIELLVENQGRIAYAPKGVHYLPDSKGIQGFVRINSETLENWNMFPLDDNLLRSSCNSNNTTVGENNKKYLVKASQKYENVPRIKLENFQQKSIFPNKVVQEEMFFSGTFLISSVTDTYLMLTGWSKGTVYINKHNVGRYWETMGPQHTLFVPKNMLLTGKNEIMLMEIDKSVCQGKKIDQCTVEFVDKPILTRREN